MLETNHQDRVKLIVIRENSTFYVMSVERKTYDYIISRYNELCPDASKPFYFYDEFLQTILDEYVKLNNLI